VNQHLTVAATLQTLRQQKQFQLYLILDQLGLTSSSQLAQQFQSANQNLSQHQPANQQPPQSLSSTNHQPFMLSPVNQ
jgi:hypothetical protein